MCAEWRQLLYLEGSIIKKCEVFQGATKNIRKKKEVSYHTRWSVFVFSLNYKENLCFGMVTQTTSFVSSFVILCYSLLLLEIDGKAERRKP
jgi:hypothetical protein